MARVTFEECADRAGKNWRFDQCDAINPADLMERHRHNLPEWLVQPLRTSWAMSSGPWPKAWRRTRRWTCASTFERKTG